MDGDGLGDGIHPLIGGKPGKELSACPYRQDLYAGSCSWDIGMKFGVVAYVNSVSLSPIVSRVWMQWGRMVE